MKTLNILLISIIIFTGALVSARAVAQPGYGAVSFNRFYAELSPYGRWVNMPRYGRVWIYSEPGFRPYETNGQWEETDMGWSWASDYAWGAIPFHYGRWELDPYYGWIWIPGYEYAPAWVMWSEADDYFGWAPLGFGMSINISIGRIPSNRWIYTQRRYMGYRGIANYCVPYRRNSFYYHRQRPVINIYTHRNVRYQYGPRFENRSDRPSRPSLRPGQYDNNNGSRPGNINRSEDNNIRLDPSRYDRRRAIGQRPDRATPAPSTQERPDPEQRSIDNDSRPSNPVITPRPTNPREQGSGDRPVRRYEPRTNNNQSQVRERATPPPQVRERTAPQPQVRERNDAGARPPMVRDRRIH